MTAVRTWEPYQNLVDAAYERRRKRWLWTSIALVNGTVIAAVPLLMTGQWLLWLIAVAVSIMWVGYRMDYSAIVRGFYKDRRRAAKRAGVCWHCLIPGERHRTFDACSRAVATWDRQHAEGGHS